MFCTITKLMLQRAISKPNFVFDFNHFLHNIYNVHIVQVYEFKALQNTSKSSQFDSASF